MNSTAQILDNIFKNSGLDKKENKVKGLYTIYNMNSTAQMTDNNFKKSLDVRKYKFGNRVCDEWNGLAEDVVMASSLVTFKAKLDHHLRNVSGFV